MSVVINGTTGITTPAVDTQGNLAYTGTLTGGTGVINIGSGQLVKLANGNVGVGVASPNTRLDIAEATVNEAIGIRASDGSGAGSIGSDGSAGTSTSLAISANRGSGNLIFKSGGFNERMRIDSAGNVGIGRTTTIGTNCRLNVQLSGTSASGYTAAGNAGIALDCGTATNGTINLVGGGDLGVFRSNTSNAFDVGIGFGSNADRILSFTTANAERMRINSSGDLLVGTTSLLGSFGGRLTVLGVSGQYAINTRVATDGDIGINFQNAAGGQPGYIQVNTNTVNYVSSSDYRLKHDIQPMTGALAKVAALKPVTYKWNADDSESQGFIAHELQEVVPECVTGEKDAVDAEGKPVYQGIDTSFLVATLTAAIQELKAELDTVKAELATLKGAQA
jgi:hypothetical protein